ncbi:MAG: DnaJ domain-containing protein [Candidatus Nitronauta litoralis]|uniref:DnaJ domain-containing protein n=1 Tax=Candidatus Nitronauta litoralis TaxID=2705533 RepID=A0A7T0BYK3_9BACT|nr:MAG: DnaJ domain-containing protein [Candidatus Nitronauta litoralis]
MNDYYQILGIPKTSSEDEIKKAYRKKAKEYHPDRNENNPQAEEKFKKISEAYAVLSDKDKRKQYDQFGDTDFHKRYSQEDIFRGFDVNEILRGFGMGGFGGGGMEDFFRGHGFAGQNPGPMKGQDIQSRLEISFEDAALGAEKNLSMRLPGGLEEVQVKIPPGVKTGSNLRLVGKGQPSPNGGPKGDLYLKLQVGSHPLFKRDGKNILIDREIKLSEAMLGTSLDIPTLFGTKSLKVPAGTQSHSKLRMKGLGVPSALGPGDQIVTLKAVYPKELTDKQKDLATSLKESGL